MVSCVQSLMTQYSLQEPFEKLQAILPAKVLSESDAIKDSVVDRVMSGSASMTHFLVHGTQSGRAG